MELEGVSPRAMEYLVGIALKRVGYDVKVTRASGDFGADLVAYKNPIRLVVEVKHHNRPAGPIVVQRLGGAMSHFGANRGLIYCTAGFTPAAIQATGSLPVSLWDKDALARRLEEGDVELAIKKANPDWTGIQ